MGRVKLTTEEIAKRQEQKEAYDEQAWEMRANDISPVPSFTEWRKQQDSSARCSPRS